MLEHIDVRALSSLGAPERAFMTLFVRAPRGLEACRKRFAQLTALVSGHPDERQHVAENIAAIERHLDAHPLTSGGLYVVSCWVLDVFEAHPLALPEGLLGDEDIVSIGAAPYVRPIAALQDDYERVAVVVADNTKASVYTVTAAATGAPEHIKGGIKNQVKKGGWSQQRYKRRRETSLSLYAGRIVEALSRLESREPFGRLFLMGSDETMRAIEGALPRQLSEKIQGTKRLDLSRTSTQGGVLDAVRELADAAERLAEAEAWAGIRERLLSGDPAVVGVQDVLDVLNQGRAHRVVIMRELDAKLSRCRACGHVNGEGASVCASCGHDALFEIDAADLCARLCASTGAQLEVVSRQEPELDAVGGVAASLRY